MGTKNKPGEFDCYEAAEPDEPMFVLLARDPLAHILVELWASLREERSPGLGRDSVKIREARRCAADMREWRREWNRHTPPGG